MGYDIRVPNRGTTITSQENLNMIIQSLPQGTNEITHIILKSQVNKKQKVSLSKNGNNQR